VRAGSAVHYISTQQVNHPGPTLYYLAKVPAGASAKTWDGAGAVWFKISDTVPRVDANKQMTWPGQSMASRWSRSGVPLVGLEKGYGKKRVALEIRFC
jgi:hypothetical protein